MSFGEFLSAMEQAEKERSGKLEHLVPHFDNEEDALAYARRLASLKAGDTVRIFNRDGTALRDAVFTGQCDSDGDPRFLVYSEDSKRMAIQCVSWFAVTL